MPTTLPTAMHWSMPTLSNACPAYRPALVDADPIKCLPCLPPCRYFPNTKQLRNQYVNLKITDTNPKLLK